MESTRIKGMVLKYYELIDQDRIEELLNLFSKDIYYKRCKNEIRGMKDFEAFYRKERSISGRHKVIRVIVQSYVAVVEGSFEGNWKDGTPIKIDFADIYFFNKEGKIYERHTYTDQGKV